MKYLIRYCILTLSIGILIGCNNPQPTELIENEDPIEIEVINQNPSEPTIFGVDSSGFGDNPASYTNLVSVAGYMVINQGLRIKSSFAQAVFFDKSKPILSPANRLIGYQTLTPGAVFFDDQRAQIRELRVRYSIDRDTTLGMRYLLHNRALLGDQFDFDFNSKINFRFNPSISPAISFDISTPPEILLNYKLSGSSADRNLGLILNWDASYVKNFEIVISIIDLQRDINFPLYRIRTTDDGKLILPKNILQELANRFNKIAFTATRKFEKRVNSSPSEFFVVSQSITSITVDLR